MNRPRPSHLIGGIVRKGARRIPAAALEADANP